MTTKGFFRGGGRPPLSAGQGFTLAEVLITLGIIGVVAALTMPSLIANHKKKEIITKLKRQYSVFLQVIKRSEADNGDIADWDWSQSVELFTETYILPYLQISKNCSTTGTDCWLPDNKAYGLHGSRIEDYSRTNYYTAVLNDGTSLVFLKQSGPHHFHITVDINGAKPPNKFGIDTFAMTLVQDKLIENNLNNVEQPGFYFQGSGLPYETLLSNCSTSDGILCGALYQHDGWEISPDVKWK